MTTLATQDPIAIRLDQALQGGALPPEGRGIGHRLMAQLNQPTRIAVAGLAGSGKTSLVNMLLGARLMPDLAGPACIELVFGDTAQVRVVLPDGTVSIGEGLAHPSSLPPQAIRVLQELPDPRLKDWSFLELTLPPDRGDRQQMLDWMIQHADIVIWCSQSFGNHERNLWSQVPDHLKDHSFLALTRADRLHMKGQLQSRIAELGPIVAEEFLGLFPVATLQAAAARKAGGSEFGALWQSSGAKALVDAIQRQVDQARTASLDHAFVLLERYKAALADPARLVGSAPLPAPQTATQPPPPAPTAGADAKALLRQALAILQDCAEDLLAGTGEGAPDPADHILGRCASAAEDLVHLLTETEGAHPDLDVLKDDAIEGEQMLMLLRLERGETAAEDCLTLLVQLKTEMSERLAS